MLLFGKALFDGWGILDSISDYYYSASMGSVFVGGLVALAILLISYHYARVDTLAGVAAGICAIFVALFPTAPTDATPRQVVVGTVHYVFAAAFFVILAYFALFLFTKPVAPFAKQRASLSRILLRKPVVPLEKPPVYYLTHRKRQRNQVYVACGSTIVACIVLLLLLRLPGVPQLVSLHPVYWLETLAICAFGVAWIVKGEVILKDEGAQADLVQYTVAKLREWLHGLWHR
ncbi:MAG TPA: hypothetical protein VGS80_12255 [Ktedonobacterales bacterium]|nr:hypothetical protein [Ktedonobacterales bacterium]